MKRWWHYVILGVVAWLLFLVWRVPASVVTEMVNKQPNLQAQLVGVDGSVWQGRARQLVYQGKALGELSWQLSAWSLLIGKMSATALVSQHDAYVEASLNRSLSGGESTLSAVNGRLPMSILQPYLKSLPLPLDGVLSLKLNEIIVSENGVLQHAEGRVVWHQAGVTVPQPLSFGDLQMSLSPNNEGDIEGAISDSGGPLEVKGLLVLNKQGGYQVSGQLKERDSAPQPLVQSLSLMGRRDSEGYYSFSYSGQI